MPIRPLSPHIQIYKPQLTSCLSFLHRLTGTVLCLGSLLWLGWLYALAYDPPLYYALLSFFFAPWGKAVTLTVLWTFFYHFLNGIRHLLWDIGWGMDLAMVYISGWCVVFCAVSCAVLSYSFLYF